MLTELFIIASGALAGVAALAVVVVTTEGVLRWLDRRQRRQRRLERRTEP